MNMTTLIETYQQTKRERDGLDEQIRTLRSNRAQLQQRLTNTEATLAAGQQGRVEELLQGKDNAKSLNKAVGLTLFAQDAKQALAVSEQSETEFYLPLYEAQQRLDAVVKQMADHYLDLLEGKGLASVENGLDEVLWPLANLVKVKGGGKDRFRLDDKGGRGTFICNQCGSGDGLDLVARVTGKPIKEAAHLVAGALGLSHVAIHPDERERLLQQQQARAVAEQQQQQIQRQKAARRAADIMRDCKPGQASYLVHKRLRWPSGLLNSTLIRVGEESRPAKRRTTGGTRKASCRKYVSSG